MYKLLIVEDERWEREGLVDYLDWSEMGISIEGAAANGVQGLKLAQESNPDIIITDIKMPNMDGIEFATKVIQFLPDCKIIFITGYDDFEYAKEAICLGVVDYLLKPVQKDQLVEVLNKTVKMISEEKKYQKYISSLNHHLAESVYEDRERVLINMIEGTLNVPKDLEATGCSNLISLVSGVTAIVMRFDLISIFHGKGYNDKRIFLKKLFLQICKIVGDQGITARNNTETNEIIICLPGAVNTRERVRDIVSRIRQECSDAKLPEVVIGVGSFSKVLQGFAVSFIQARSALDHVFFIRDKDILFYEDMPQRDELNETETYGLYSSALVYSKKVLNGIVSMDSKCVAVVADELFEIIEKRSADKGSVCNLIAGLVSEISTLLFSYDIYVNFKMLTEDILGTLYEFIKLKDMKEWFKELLQHANYCITDEKNNKEEYIAAKVMDIIKEEYESSIGIETIAARLELSPNYLGALFKQYTGKNFIEVLTDIRMKRAEELLISGTETLNFVATKVGFVNVSHFCKVFKKRNGISPMDYRKRYAI